MPFAWHWYHPGTSLLLCIPETPQGCGKAHVLGCSWVHPTVFSRPWVTEITLEFQVSLGPGTKEVATRSSLSALRREPVPPLIPSPTPPSLALHFLASPQDIWEYLKESQRVSVLKLFILLIIIIIKVIEKPHVETPDIPRPYCFPFKLSALVN